MVDGDACYRSRSDSTSMEWWVWRVYSKLRRRSMRSVSRSQLPRYVSSFLQLMCVLLFMTPPVLTAICSCTSNTVLPSSNAVLLADLLLQGHHCVFIEVWFWQDTKMADAPAAAPAKPDEQPATDGEVRSNGPSEVCSKAKCLKAVFQCILPH